MLFAWASLRAGDPAAPQAREVAFPGSQVLLTEMGDLSVMTAISGRLRGTGCLFPQSKSDKPREDEKLLRGAVRGGQVGREAVEDLIFLSGKLSCGAFGRGHHSVLADFLDVSLQEPSALPDLLCFPLKESDSRPRQSAPTGSVLSAAPRRAGMGHIKMNGAGP